jgi:hypothetical protein
VRDAATWGLAAGRRHKRAFLRLVHSLRLPNLSPLDRAVVDELNRFGGASSHLDELKMGGSDVLLASSEHLMEEMTRLPSRTDAKKYVVSAPADLIGRYPEILRWGLNERLLSIAENYIGESVVYRGVLARLDLPDGIVDETRLWHLDQEDSRILKVIVYLDDIDQNGGPFEYLPARAFVPAHLFDGPKMRIRDELELVRAVPASERRALTGRRGTVGFADTCSVIHRGRLPVGHIRRTLFFCYNAANPNRPSYCMPLFEVDKFKASVPDLTRRQLLAIDFRY